MKTYDVQNVRIDRKPDDVFDYVAQAARLPEWAEAFASVEGNRATLRTPQGEVAIGLEVLANRDCGTIDWRLLFPDGSIERAHSRVVGGGDGETIFTFVLTPSAPMLEQLEGDITQQSATLARELETLRRRLTNGHG